MQRKTYRVIPNSFPVIPSRHPELVSGSESLVTVVSDPETSSGGRRDDDGRASGRTDGQTGCLKDELRKA